MARLALLFAAGLFLTFCPRAPSPAQASQGVGFRVSPTYINPTIAIGDETSEAVTLQNSSDFQIVVHTAVGPSDESRAVISLDQDQVTLKPGESRVIYVRISVPEEASPEKWQQTILFDEAPATGANVAIVGRVSTVLDLTVINPVGDTGFSFPRLIDSTEAAVFGATGRNTGNFTTRLKERIDLSGFLSGDTSLEAVSDPTGIGETADLQAIWSDSPIFSISRANLSVGSGVGNPARTSALVIVFPWKLTLMLGLISATALAGAFLEPETAKVFAAKWRRIRREEAL